MLHYLLKPTSELYDFAILILRRCKLSITNFSIFAFIVHSYCTLTQNDLSSATLQSHKQAGYLIIIYALGKW